jgi:hypothetical protein
MYERQIVTYAKYYWDVLGERTADHHDSISVHCVAWRWSVPAHHWQRVLMSPDDALSMRSRLHPVAVMLQPHSALGML